MEELDVNGGDDEIGGAVTVLLGANERGDGVQEILRGGLIPSDGRRWRGGGKQRKRG